MTGDRRDDLFERGAARSTPNDGGRVDPVAETVELSHGAVAPRASDSGTRSPARNLVLLIAGAVALGAASFAIVDAARNDGSPASSAQPVSTQTATLPPTEATQTTTAPESTAVAPVLGALVPVAAEDTGEDVRRLQEALAELGLSTGVADGIYGDATVAAVAAFQRSVGLTEDGIAGPETIAALQEALTRN